VLCAVGYTGRRTAATFARQAIYKYAVDFLRSAVTFIRISLSCQMRSLLIQIQVYWTC